MENGDDSSLENVEPEPEDDLHQASYLDGHSFSSNDDGAEDEKPTKSSCSDGNGVRPFTPAEDQLILSTDEETRESALDDSLVESGAALKNALESMGNSCHASQDLQLSSDSSFSDLNSSNTTNNDLQTSEEVDRSKCNSTENLDNLISNDLSDSCVKSAECDETKRTINSIVSGNNSQDDCHSIDEPNRNSYEGNDLGGTKDLTDQELLSVSTEESSPKDSKKNEEVVTYFGLKEFKPTFLKVLFCEL